MNNIKLPNQSYKTFVIEIKDIEEPEYTFVTIVLDNNGLFGIWQGFEVGSYQRIWRVY